MTLSANSIFTKGEWHQLAEKLALPLRQAQIARCILSGLSDKQIAKKVGISIPTVRTHLGRLFAKLGVADRTELALSLFGRFRAGCRQVNCPRRQ